MGWSRKIVLTVKKIAAVIPAPGIDLERIGALDILELGAVRAKINPGRNK